MIAVRVHFPQNYARSETTAALQKLERAGISSLDSDIGPSPMLVFFNEVTSGLCELIRGMGRRGLGRVLAIATKRPIEDADVWRMLESGASDVFASCGADWVVDDVAARLARWEKVDNIVDSPVVRENLVGRSPAWISLLRQVVEIAYFTDASMLIMGESGTGKELLARLIHKLDARPNKCELVLLDCTTIVPELSGTEFFGHQRGAYTGAMSSRDGAFALADRGTLFLDEVGELPIKLQAELLRIVQEGTYKALGSNTWSKTSFRLVCATNRDLQQEEAAGRFRRDLYYRIASYICKVPSLRERSEDIIPLAEHFLRRLRPSGEPPEFDAPVRQYLLSREYPGNVRDLQQVVARMSHRHVGRGRITVGDICPEERSKIDSKANQWRDAHFEHAIRRAVYTGVGLRQLAGTVIQTAIDIAVREENGNLKRAAQMLKITDRALQMRRAADRHRLQEL